MSRLTDLQLRFWAERGYLIVKGAFSPSDIFALRGLAAGVLDNAEARRRFRSILDGALQAVAHDLVGEDVVTLDVARRGPASSPFHLDAWLTSDVGNRSIFLLVALTDIGGETAPLFYPGSHLFASEGSESKGRTPAEMARLTTWLSGDGQKVVGLTCAAGDIWVRHPRLLHGSTSGSADDWLGLEARCLPVASLPRNPAMADIFGSV